MVTVNVSVNYGNYTGNKYALSGRINRYASICIFYLTMNNDTFDRNNKNKLQTNKMAGKTTNGRENAKKKNKIKQIKGAINMKIKLVLREFYVHTDERVKE